MAFLGYFKLASKNLVAILPLFLWRQMTLVTMDNMLSDAGDIERFTIFTIYYLSVAIFTIISSIISEKSSKNLCIRIWIILTVIASLVLFIPERMSCYIIYSLLSGLSFGFGLPLCLTYFANNTTTENRGRIGAITFFLTSLTFVPAAVIIRIFGLYVSSVLLIIFMIFIFILFSKITMKELNKTKAAVNFSSIINKPFLFYFISSSMFWFIDQLGGPILQQFLNKTFGREFRDLLLSIETVMTAFSTLIAGFLIDFYGRKKVLIYGFVTLGIAYAIAGVAAFSPLSWYIFSIVNGTALGFFIIVFVLTIWGDLSSWREQGKYYAIGSLPFSLSSIVREAVTTTNLLVIPINATFSFASFFLFLAVIPLMYAPETLPEKIIKQRELKKYIEKAKKIREKYEKQ